MQTENSTYISIYSTTKNLFRDHLPLVHRYDEFNSNIIVLFAISVIILQ